MEDTETLREAIPEALALARAREGPIDLLLTEVVMPKLGGQLAQRVICGRRGSYGKMRKRQRDAHHG